MTEFEACIKKLEAITDPIEYRTQLGELSKQELYEYCKAQGLKGCSSFNRTKLINHLVDAHTQKKSDLFNTFDFNEAVGIKNTLPKE